MPRRVRSEDYSVIGIRLPAYAEDMLKRGLKHAGLPAHYSPHSFRATGITNFLEIDGALEAAQRIASHADSRTTKLHDRRGQKVLLEDTQRFDIDRNQLMSEICAQNYLLFLNRERRYAIFTA